MILEKTNEINKAEGVVNLQFFYPKLKAAYVMKQLLTF